LKNFVRPERFVLLVLIIGILAYQEKPLGWFHSSITITVQDNQITRDVETIAGVAMDSGSSGLPVSRVT
jgi:hypothetical protein